MTENENLSNLYPTRSVYTLIGFLCNSPQMVRNPDYPLDQGDFYQDFHKNIFAAINNIAYSDGEVEKITPVDIDNYLAEYPKNYKVWEQHDGFTYVESAIKNVNMKTYKSNYNRVKKFALLRDYVESGIDVSTIYDHSGTDLVKQEEDMKNLDKMSIDSIIEHFQLKMIKLRDKWSMGDIRKSFMAGDGLSGILERLKEEPEMGYPFQNGLYNTVFRGQRQTKFMLRSAGTGVGKTRLSLADMCNISCDMTWSYEAKDYVPNGPAYPTLFISTELEQEELQTGMLAHISGVDEDVIKDGKYSKEVEQRLLRGIEIIERAPIYAEVVEDFSIGDIETIIEENILDNDVKFVAFDYIQMVPKLARTMQEAFGNSLREDQILVQLSSSLKLLANKYKVYIVSATQVNRNAKEHEMRDTTSLRGGSATADKVDYGVMVFRATKKDLDNLKHITERGFNYDKPNFCHYVYKNRGNSRVGVIIWTDYNGGTIRETPLFVTDLDFNLLNKVEIMDVEFDEDGNSSESINVEAESKFIDEHMNISEDDVPNF